MNPRKSQKPQNGLRDPVLKNKTKTPLMLRFVCNACVCSLRVADPARAFQPPVMMCRCRLFPRQPFLLRRQGIDLLARLHQTAVVLVLQLGADFVEGE